MKKAIIVRISGGLGNQLFQYALGRALAKKNDACLLWDVSFYKQTFSHDTKRVFLLNVFYTKGREMEDADQKLIGLPNMRDLSLIGKIRRTLFRAIEQKKPISKKRFITEPHFSFCSEILTIKNSCYLSGVWQSELYFKEIAEIIREELVLKEAPSNEMVKWIHQVEDCPSVAIHIRRGDYIANKKTHEFHGTCSIDYYMDAIRFLEKKIKNPVFFIFSDDIVWAKAHLKIKHPVFFVSHSNLKDYEELMIMSRCSHAIIANSSFSWWAAWLNTYQEKIIIAPKKWFNVTSIDTDTLIPSSWLQM